MAGPDFYTTLGVPRTASPDEIKSAHRELVKKNHPDLFPGATQKARANKKLQQINEAYATLSNAERRRQYDSRYFQKATVVKPAAAAGERRSTAGFRRPPAVPAWENLARRADEKLQRIAKSFSGFIARRPGIIITILRRRRAPQSKRRRAKPIPTRSSMLPLPEGFGILSGAGPAGFPSR